MNILKLLDINDIGFVIKENLKHQIKELLDNTPSSPDKVAFVNEGVMEYVIRYGDIGHSIAFHLKSTRDKEFLLKYLEKNGMNLLDFSKAYSEYADEQDFVIVFPESQEFRFFDEQEIEEYVKELVPYLVEVAFSDFIRKILGE